MRRGSNFKVDCGRRLIKNATLQNGLKALKSAVAAYGKPRQLTSATMEHNSHPQFNGKVEKAAGTIMKFTRHFGGFEKALNYYNYREPHWSLRRIEHYVACKEKINHQEEHQDEC
ncbi:MAG: hypothetical protein QXH42_01840 [Thermoplasmata archaeon]